MGKISHRPEEFVSTHGTASTVPGTHTPEHMSTAGITLRKPDRSRQEPTGGPASRCADAPAQPPSGRNKTDPSERPVHTHQRGGQRGVLQQQVPARLQVNGTFREQPGGARRADGYRLCASAVHPPCNK